MKRLYPAFNALFHLVHVTLILFVLLGWMWAPTRTAHLVLTLLTLASWFVLGIWMGPGYCPVTSWHWAIKESLGGGRPEATYVQLLGETLLRRHLNSSAIDRLVVVTTLIVATASLVLNAKRFF